MFTLKETKINRENRSTRKKKKKLILIQRLYNMIPYLISFIIYSIIIGTVCSELSVEE